MRVISPSWLIAASLVAVSLAGCSGSKTPDNNAATGDGAAGANAAASILIVNASIVDGTGSARRIGGLRIAGDRIAAVGDVTPKTGERTIDAHGLVLAPGFIDTHSHADRDLDEDTTALAAVTQGITTIIGGQDGGSPASLAAFFAGVEKRPPPVNVGMYVGHGSLREQVMGKDFRRRATPNEIERMRTVLRAELAAGAIGLSTGLEYDPGIYSATEELLALARDVAASGGRYISHIRSEDRDFWKAIDEIIHIGREAKLPVQISHTKLAMKSLWGKADSLIAILDRARASGVDITADIYPYLYWQSTLTVLFPKRDFDNRASAEFAVTETSTPAGLLLSHYAPNEQYAGKTVADVARLRGVDSLTALIDLIREAESMKVRLGPDSPVNVESVIGTSMVEEDVERIMRWPHTNFCTDGSLTGNHPRSFGSYPRVFGHYVRNRQVMSLEEAVRRATSLAATHMGIRDRGTLTSGSAADLVLFDPATITDRATPQAPHAVSAGVERVWVNGVEVVVDGRPTGARAGRVVRR
jgi:N-acyl-D-amino-acid deacylase